MTEQLDEAVLVLYAHNRPGVLAKVASAFYRRGINIVALRASPTRRPDESEIEIHAVAPPGEIERVAAGLRNLIDVLSVESRAHAETAVSE